MKQLWPFGPLSPGEVVPENEHREKRETDTTLQTANEKQLRAWLKKARRNGGVYEPRHGYRDFTVAQITAALAALRDRK